MSSSPIEHNFPVDDADVPMRSFRPLRPSGDNGIFASTALIGLLGSVPETSIEGSRLGKGGG